MKGFTGEIFRASLLVLIEYNCSLSSRIRESEKLKLVNDDIVCLQLLWVQCERNALELLNHKAVAKFCEAVCILATLIAMRS
jgi:hypothetical protein